jgi:hypothetical protein
LLSHAEVQVRLRDHLVAALAADLVGPMRVDERLGAPPSRWYLTGFLVPVGAPEAQRVDPLADEALGIDEDPDGEPSDDVRGERPFLPSSLGLSVFLPADAPPLRVVARWAEYRELDAEESRALRARDRQWRRFGPDEPDEDEGPDDGDRTARVFPCWARQPEVLVTVAVDAHGGADRWTVAEGVTLRGVRRKLPGGGTALSLFLVNEREPASGTRADERTLFQASLRVEAPGGLSPRVRPPTGSHADDQRDDLQYRDRAEWAVGHGVATQAEVVDGRCLAVQTTWVPTCPVFRTRTREVPGVETSMRALAALPDAAALSVALEPLFRAWDAWIADVEVRGRALSTERRRTAELLVDEARRARSRMRDGLALLAEDPRAFMAFQLANQAMADAAAQARPGEPRWRLFQLAFFLLNLRGVTDPTHPDRDAVELLFFPTGGGKTEAYLGVVAYLLALRRLRGQGQPHRGLGVAVFMRYTLRLLTLDQLRRAAQLICALELLRRSRPALLGPERFAVGMWVGKAVSPLRIKDAVDALRQLKTRGKVWGQAPAVPVEACPWCGTTLSADHMFAQPPGAHPVGIVVGCADLSCPFALGADPTQPTWRDGIPLVAVDEQVYRELPALLIGTVDKFASLPWRGAVGALFGRAHAEAPTGFLPEDATPSAEDVPLPDGLLPPELILQDELHLITGPLGTMVGLYETAVDALCRDRVGYGPKIIASTATARRAQAQVQALYARDRLHLFPPQGIDEGDTFFALPDLTPAASRLYVGVAAPGRSPKVIAARTWTALLAAAQKGYEAHPRADNPADTYMTLVAYFNALRDLGGAQRLIQEDVFQRLRRASWRRPIDQPDNPWFADRRLAFELLELTSRRPTDEIAKTIQILNQPFRSEKGKISDVLLASSMISVGVDIPRLGLMVVNNQPKAAAEYIQATSRVGRQTPGLVVTTFSLYRPRDRSHFERFEAWHQGFYREVEAASVTPFSARAIDRGLAALVVGLSRHLGPGFAKNDRATQIRRRDHAEKLRERLVRLLTDRARAHRPDVQEEAVNMLRQRVEAVLRQWVEVVGALQAAAGTLRYSPWEPPQNHRPLLSTAIDDLTGDEAELLDKFRAPTSMRDVEPGVHVWVDLPVQRGAP